MQAKEFLDFLAIFEKLKDTTRHSWTSKGRHESVAEHSWRLAVMAFLMQDDLRDLKIDINKTIAMCLFHDLGESVTGDIPAWRKTEKDRETETQELKKLVSSFPQPIKNRLEPLLIEFEEQKTIEAKFAKALDKFEAIIQHNEANLSTWTETEVFSHTANFTYLDNHLLTPFLEELKGELHSQMWDKVKKSSS